MFFKSQIKISQNYGDDYIEKVIDYLDSFFSISLINTNEIEMDLKYHEYYVNKKKVTFISEGTVGTHILGHKKIVNTILEKVKNEKPELFDMSHINL